MTSAWALEELVPHAAPMILIDEVTANSDGKVGARVRITEESLFYEPNRGVPAYVGIEYIAQTVAALVGMRAKSSGGEVGLGYLLGARNYTAHVAYFPLGSLLTVNVSAEFESVDLAAYQGEIRDSTGQQLVETSINLYSGEIETRP